jgi:hypothetical protein
MILLCIFISHPFYLFLTLISFLHFSVTTSNYSYVIFCKLDGTVSNTDLPSTRDMWRLLRRDDDILQIHVAFNVFWPCVEHRINRFMGFVHRSEFYITRKLSQLFRIRYGGKSWETGQFWGLEFLMGWNAIILSVHGEGMLGLTHS